GGGGARGAAGPGPGPDRRAAGALRDVGCGEPERARRARGAEATAVRDRVPEHVARRRRRDARWRCARLMDRVVGIDLGTTNSLVAVLDGDSPRVLPDPETGATLLPSAAAFLAGDVVRVGEAARALAAERPFDTILSVKRFMGLGLEHVSEEDRRRYRFVEGSEGVVRFAVAGREVTAPEVSAH